MDGADQDTLFSQVMRWRRLLAYLLPLRAAVADWAEDAGMIQDPGDEDEPEPERPWPQDPDPPPPERLTALVTSTLTAAPPRRSVTAGRAQAA